MNAPTLTGEARFGFVSRYQRGQSVPTGTTRFHFRVGDLRFKSEAYHWLVVAGARAQFKGWGTINGSGAYGFMITAIDGDVHGGHDTDRLRMKIWDSVTGDMVYDNQLGDPDEAEVIGLVAGGGITIKAN